MQAISVRIGDEEFRAEFQNGLAPATCRWFQSLLPWRRTLIQARWSGEACWIPLGGAKVDVGLEHAITSPSPGQFLFYPGGKSETRYCSHTVRPTSAAKPGNSRVTRS